MKGVNEMEKTAVKKLKYLKGNCPHCHEKTVVLLQSGNGFCISCRQTVDPALFSPSTDDNDMIPIPTVS